jgi:translation elongation factor EF-G
LGELVEQSCAVAGIFGYPVTDLEVRILEAPLEPGFTTETGLRAATQRGLMMALRSSGSALLEPIMSLELTAPAEYTGKVLGSLQKKNGRVEGVTSRGTLEIVKARVPLAEMFGYMSEVRSVTREASMEFSLIWLRLDMAQRFHLCSGDTIEETECAEDDQDEIVATYHQRKCREKYQRCEISGWCAQEVALSCGNLQT